MDVRRWLHVRKKRSIFQAYSFVAKLKGNSAQRSNGWSMDQGKRQAMSSKNWNSQYRTGLGKNCDCKANGSRAEL